MTLEGLKLEITGDYPKGNEITVRASGMPNAKVVFRKPEWCPDLKVSETSPQMWKLVFDMNPRLVERNLPAEHYVEPSKDIPEEERLRNLGYYMRKRFADGNFQAGGDVLRQYRASPAAEVMYGPLLLAKAKRVGDTEAEIFDPMTVNGKGYSVKVTPIGCDRVWCAFDVELTKPGARTIRVKACDFQSAGDEPLSRGANAFSIWF